MDFTINTYRKLLEALIAQGYSFQTFADFLIQPQPHSVILRHDVEAKYDNSLAFAKIQHDFQIRGTYYFRFLPYHFSTEIIQQIASLGHETGYHYDDLSNCKGDYDKAIRRFEKNLATLREIAEVKTICMEGAPLSKWDNRDLWRQGDRGTGRQRDEGTGGDFSFHASRFTPHYSDYGIIGEPYFDLDFSKILYLTDTGRRWDGKASVRDKVGQLDNINSKFKIQNSKFHSTSDIIIAANRGLLPDQIMLTFHPQRWTDKPLPWLQELVLQNVKNVVKRIVLRFQG